MEFLGLVRNRCRGERDTRSRTVRFRQVLALVTDIGNKDKEQALGGKY